MQLQSCQNQINQFTFKLSACENQRKAAEDKLNEQSITDLLGKFSTTTVKHIINDLGIVEAHKEANELSKDLGNIPNNKLYVFGGKTLSTNRKREYLDDKIEVFDLKTQQIIIDNTNSHQAINFAAFAYQDNIIVMGGSIKLKNNGEKIYSDKSHLYNITSGYWYELPKMTKAKEVNGIIIKSKTYLIGGFNNYPLTEIESYDLITEKWEKEGDLFYGIENPALTYHNDTIYIFNEDKIMTYNIKTRILNEYKIDLNIKNAQIHYYKNNLYIVGGIIEDYYSKTPSSGLYSINLNEFYKTKI
mgnify:CR=1 FL=1